MSKYTLENVLYFASKPRGFNIDKREYNVGKTTSAEIVHNCVKSGRLEQSGDDGKNLYFKTTVKGEIKLAEMKLCYRRAHGKDETEVLARLAELKKLLN